MVRRQSQCVESIVGWGWDWWGGKSQEYSVPLVMLRTLAWYSEQWAPIKGFDIYQSQGEGFWHDFVCILKSLWVQYRPYIGENFTSNDRESRIINQSNICAKKWMNLRNSGKKLFVTWWRTGCGIGQWQDGALVSDSGAYMSTLSLYQRRSVVGFSVPFFFL
jgi:hypothetical protein